MGRVAQLELRPFLAETQTGLESSAKVGLVPVVEVEQAQVQWAGLWSWACPAAAGWACRPAPQLLLRPAASLLYPASFGIAAFAYFAAAP